MNKKAIILALSIIMLTGCGKKTEDTNSTKSNKTSVESSEKVKDDNKSNTNKEKENKEAEKIDDDSFVNPKNIGKTIGNDQLDYEIKKAGVKENEYTTGPFKVKITGVSAGIMTPKSEEMKSFLQDRENTQVIILFATVENTEDKKANLYLNQSLITTDTQEQLEPDLLLSEGSGEFLSAVKQDMTMVYYPQTDVEKTKEIVLHVEAPSDENFETIGDELNITITFNDKGEFESIK
ncbi:hypothetical protein [Anaerococcus hydrogenalis]|uniref:hypothetical protein n=1 Tax=Anaerococcus hydrogenalis TaxID=33029 RepID=UPI002901F124|nr:hypothetical protein [Anaerococcus hydrogenalis]MDU1315611.1 hypothetical protein [Anaerococcus hydrogenalis]